MQMQDDTDDAAAYRISTSRVTQASPGLAVHVTVIRFIPDYKLNMMLAAITGRPGTYVTPQVQANAAFPSG